MTSLRKNTRRHTAEIIQLPIEAVIPNPYQPRTQFEPQGLRELAFSIEQHGILQPLSVRQVGKAYELVSGERRLRAARLAGLSVVPCILIQVDDTEASLLSLVENTQRRDLDFFEIAFSYQRLIQVFRLTQEQTALRVGKSQSTVANKLRLLRFSNPDIAFIRASGLTERHCRSILRLSPERYHQALESVAARGLSVAETESYVDNLLRTARAESDTSSSTMDTDEASAMSDSMENAVISPVMALPLSEKEAVVSEKPAATEKMAIQDARIYLNSIRRTCERMCRDGIQADCEEHQYTDYTELTIRIPQPAAKKRKKSCLY